MDLSFSTRQEFGSSASKALRKKGLIPAELYGHKVENEHIAIDAKSFNKVFKEVGTNTIIYLVNESEKTKGGKKAVIIYDIKKHRTSGEILNIDFYVVNMNETITTKVPLEFINESRAVKELGAVLNKSMSEIEIEALPNDLPHFLEIDLSLLDELDKSIYVKDLKSAKGVKILVEEDTVIASVDLPKEEIVEEKPVDVSSVKVEGEEKRVDKETTEEDK